MFRRLQSVISPMSAMRIDPANESELQTKLHLTTQYLVNAPKQFDAWMQLQTYNRLHYNLYEIYQKAQLGQVRQQDLVCIYQFYTLLIINCKDELLICKLVSDDFVIEMCQLSKLPAELASQLQAYRINLIKAYMGTISPEIVKYMVVQDKFKVFYTCVQLYASKMGSGTVQLTTIANSLLNVMKKVDQIPYLWESVWVPQGLQLLLTQCFSFIQLQLSGAKKSRPQSQKQIQTSKQIQKVQNGQTKPTLEQNDPKQKQIQQKEHKIIQNKNQQTGNNQISAGQKQDQQKKSDNNGTTNQQKQLTNEQNEQQKQEVEQQPQQRLKNKEQQQNKSEQKIEQQLSDKIQNNRQDKQTIAKNEQTIKEQKEEQKEEQKAQQMQKQSVKRGQKQQKQMGQLRIQQQYLQILYEHILFIVQLISSMSNKQNLKQIYEYSYMYLQQILQQITKYKKYHSKIYSYSILFNLFKHYQFQQQSVEHVMSTWFNQILQFIGQTHLFKISQQNTNTNTNMNTNMNTNTNMNMNTNTNTNMNMNMNMNMNTNMNTNTNMNMNMNTNTNTNMNMNMKQQKQQQNRDKIKGNKGQHINELLCRSMFILCKIISSKYSLLSQRVLDEGVISMDKIKNIKQTRQLIVNILIDRIQSCMDHLQTSQPDLLMQFIKNVLLTAFQLKVVMGLTGRGSKLTHKNNTNNNNNNTNNNNNNNNNNSNNNSNNNNNNSSNTFNTLNSNDEIDEKQKQLSHRLDESILQLFLCYTEQFKKLMYRNQLWSNIIKWYEQGTNQVTHTLLSLPDNFQRVPQDRSYIIMLTYEYIKNYRYMIVQYTTLDPKAIKQQKFYHSTFSSPGLSFQPGKTINQIVHTVCPCLLHHNYQQIPVVVLQDKQCFIIAIKLNANQHKILINIKFKDIQGFVYGSTQSSQGWTNHQTPKFIKINLRGSQQIILEFSNPKVVGNGFKDYLIRSRDVTRQRQLTFLNAWAKDYQADTQKSLEIVKQKLNKQQNIHV